MGNLNYRTTKEGLVAFLSPAGEVVDAFLPADRETGRPRGFGFITFASAEQASACIEQFNGQELDGRMLNINAAEDRRRGPPSPRGGPPGRESRMDRSGPPRHDGSPRSGPFHGAGPRRPRPSPIAEFKRGDGPVRRGPAPPPEELEVSYDADERKFNEDGAAGSPDDPPWKKKKKKRKGSRRGLRAKKRSI